MVIPFPQQLSSAELVVHTIYLNLALSLDDSDFPNQWTVHNPSSVRFQES